MGSYLAAPPTATTPAGEPAGVVAVMAWNAVAGFPRRSCLAILDFMGNLRAPDPVLLIAAAFSRHSLALEWARQRAVRAWGPVALESPVFEFVETRFYEATMGTGLRKMFLAFEQRIDAGRLVELKRATNAWEDEFREEHQFSEPRPLNIDPGYVSEAKLVLATTKDRDHRIYLDRGIFAEVTLCFQERQWQARPWTYPDYRRADYHQFFTRCRDYLRQRHRATPDRRDE